MLLTTCSVINHLICSLYNSKEEKMNDLQCTELLFSSRGSCVMLNISTTLL
uniref:Uncharacterized protein n=1 Tax=Arundo donax TaxID=35708 RepID=A0A0A8XZH4_ARUDO